MLLLVVVCLLFLLGSPPSLKLQIPLACLYEAMPAGLDWVIYTSALFPPRFPKVALFPAIVGVPSVPGMPSILGIVRVTGCFRE